MLIICQQRYKKKCRQYECCLFFFLFVEQNNKHNENKIFLIKEFILWNWESFDGLFY